jgi:hypothetical protein
MTRAVRGAMGLAIGGAILETLKKEKPNLIAAAEQKRPPVAAVSRILLKRFGEEVKRTSVRQFIGLATRAILEEAGYEIEYRGVRIRGDPVFRTGAVYRPRVDGGKAPEADDALDRMMASLTSDQAKRAFRALLHQFPNLRDDVRGRKPPGRFSKGGNKSN